MVLVSVYLHVQLPLKDVKDEVLERDEHGCPSVRLENATFMTTTDFYLAVVDRKVTLFKVRVDSHIGPYSQKSFSPYFGIRLF